MEMAELYAKLQDVNRKTLIKAFELCTDAGLTCVLRPDEIDIISIDGSTKTYEEMLGVMKFVKKEVPKLVVTAALPLLAGGDKTTIGPGIGGESSGKTRIPRAEYASGMGAAEDLRTPDALRPGGEGITPQAKPKKKVK